MVLGQPRLVVTSALLLVLIAGMGIFGWTQLRSTSRAYESLVERDARLTKDILEMRVAVNEQAVAVRGYLLSDGDPGFLAAYRRGVATFTRELRDARQKVDGSDELRRLAEIERRHDAVRPAYRREIALADDGRFWQAVQVARERGTPKHDLLVSSLDELVSEEADQLYRGQEKAGKLEATAEMAILGVLALALVAGASAAALAIRGKGDKEAIEDARGAAAEEAALARIATAIAREQEPRAVLTSAAEEAAGLLGAASAAILRFEPGHREAVVVGVAGSVQLGDGRRLSIQEDDLIGRSLSAERAVAGGTGSAKDGVSRPLRPADGGAKLAVPIWIGADAWGATWVAWAPETEVPSHAGDRLGRFAELAFAAITSANARAHLAQLALEDSLTGLANHRHFHERLRSEVARAQRHGRELSVVLFDIDHFKDVNDSHGHHVGDLVLRETADRLSRCARSGELPAWAGRSSAGSSRRPAVWTPIRRRSAPVAR